MDTPEEWRPVVGWPEYEVSSLGRVRRVSAARGTKEGRILRPHVRKRRGRQEHLRVELSADGRRRRAFVHQLVCEAFHGPPPTPAHRVRHLDGEYQNNTPDNVVWGTSKENGDDSRRLGEMASGSRHPCAQFTDADVIEIRRLRHERRLTYPQIAERFGRSKSAIRKICLRRTWRHVPAAEALALIPEKR